MDEDHEPAPLLTTIAVTVKAGGLSTITRSQARYASGAVDVLVYIVVLNLFVEFVDDIVIESFWISILTAILLKLLLDALVGVEHRVGRYLRAREGTLYKVLAFASVFLILFFGKFLILEVVNVVFGDQVDLGHFFHIAALIVAMILVRGALRWIYERLGDRTAIQQPE
jgi:hypothetical protein